MALYVYECPKQGQFEKLQGMFSLHTCACPQCGEDTRRVFTMPNVRMAIPLIFLQERPHGQKPIEIGRIPDSYSSDDRNPDIPPDYPNLLEV